MICGTRGFESLSTFTCTIGSKLETESRTGTVQELQKLSRSLLFITVLPFTALLIYHQPVHLGQSGISCFQYIYIPRPSTDRRLTYELSGIRALWKTSTAVLIVIQTWALRHYGLLNEHSTTIRQLWCIKYILVSIVSVSLTLAYGTMNDKWTMFS